MIDQGIASNLFWQSDRCCKVKNKTILHRLLRGLPPEPPPQQLRRKVSFIHHDVFSSCSLALQKLRASENHAGRKFLKSIVKKVGPKKSRPEKKDTYISRCNELSSFYKTNKEPKMILRAQAVGEHPSVRFFILNVRNNLMWDGESFVGDFDLARKYWHPSDACGEMQDILREHYGQLRRRRFVVPVEIEVYGSVSQKEIAEYLYRASVLRIRTEEHGNGPAECLVLPTVHWGYIRELKLPLSKKPENPAVEWGLEDENRGDDQ